jgi:hypothetical protein
MADKVIAADTETWLLIPAVEVLGDPYAIGVAGKDKIDLLTAALVNEYLSIVDRASAGYTGAGGNVTLAVRDDSTLALTDSETDADRAINASGNTIVPTSQNYDASMMIFRDKDSSATDSTYNLATDATRARGIKYLAFRRIGSAFDAVAVAGQKYSAYYVETDHPIDSYGDGSNQAVEVMYITKSIASTDTILL